MGDMLKNKPYYTIDIEKENCGVYVTFNGQEVFEKYTYSYEAIVKPANHWITSGDNKLEVKLLAYEEDNLTLKTNAWAKVKLKLNTFDDRTKKPIVISEIIFDNSQKTIKEKLSSSTKSAAYNSNNDFKLDNENGDIKISDIQVNEYDGYRVTERMKSTILTQNINLYTPFPRWKFLDSTEIFDGNYYNYVDTMEKYEELRKREDIQEVYNLQATIFNLIKSKNVEGVLDYLEERSNEMDRALYFKKGYYRDLFYRRVSEFANDDEYEMMEWKPYGRYFYISEDGKTLYIQQAIVFNAVGEGGSATFNMLFRKTKDNQWVITR